MALTALGGWLFGLVAVAAGALVFCCCYSLLKSAESCYLALTLLASLLGLGLVAVGLALTTVLRRQWYKAFGWLLLVVGSFGSCWGGAALCLYVIGGHLSTVPPPALFTVFQ
jgi:hypothetical protein